MLLLIFGLIMFIGLVVAHEFGHFIVARRNGVEVEEFGIGFPPAFWRKQIKSPKGDFELSLNALPLGGFVKLKGENDASKEKGSYGAANLLAKIKIMTAGVAMNLLVAYLILVFVALVGMPKLVDEQFTIQSDAKVVKQQLMVAYVEPGSPADRAGLRERDWITTVNNQAVDSAQNFPDITEDNAGQKVEISYVRDGVVNHTSAKLRTQSEVKKSIKQNDPKGYLGIGPQEYLVQRYTWSAPIVAGGLIKQFTVLTFQGLSKVVVSIFQGQGGQASEQVAGPVGIFMILKGGSMLGYQYVLLIIAVISLTLAIMNVLPIPALDGGRLFVTLLFRAIKRPLTKKKEDLIHGAGFAFLMLLFVLITVVDVKRIF